MAPRLAAALLFFVGLIAIAGVSLAASAFDAGRSAPPPPALLTPAQPAAGPGLSPSSEDSPWAELRAAIERLIEALRDGVVAAARENGPEPLEPQTPQSQAQPGPQTEPKTPSQPFANPQASPEPADASANPGCVTEREVGPGVVRTSVRCSHHEVRQDGGASSVSSTTTSSVSISSTSSSSR
jgi:hypothetical protein